MTLSPRGASAVPSGSRPKALLMVLVGGILAWVTGLWWGSETPQLWEGLASMIVSVAALGVLTVPAQLIGGRAAPPTLVALVGTFGFTFPWWIDLAFERRGTDQGVALTVLTLAVCALVVSYLAAALTRYASKRWGDA